MELNGWLLTEFFDDVSTNKVRKAIEYVDSTARSKRSYITVLGLSTIQRFNDPRILYEIYDPYEIYRIHQRCRVDMDTALRYQVYSYLYLNEDDASNVFYSIYGSEFDVNQLGPFLVTFDPEQIWGEFWYYNLERIYGPDSVISSDLKYSMHLDIDECGIANLLNSYQLWKTNIPEKVKNRWHKDRINRIHESISAEIELSKRLINYKANKFIKQCSKETERILSIINQPYDEEK